MRAVERSEVDKVAAVLSKKGIIPTKLDVEGRSAWVNAHTHLHLFIDTHVHAQYVDIHSQKCECQDVNLNYTLSPNR